MEIETKRPGARNAGPSDLCGRAEGLTERHSSRIAGSAQRLPALYERLPAWVRTAMDTAAGGSVGQRRAHCRNVAWLLRKHGWPLKTILAVAADGAAFARGIDDVTSVVAALDAEQQSCAVATAERGDFGLTISRCMDDVALEPVRWLWQDRFALGKISLLAGVPGLGKSQLSCAMIAAVTTGRRWPDDAPAPLGSAIIVACEDDAGDTIGPRLAAAGADLKRVHMLDWVRTRDGETREHYDVRRHAAALGDLIARVGDVRLVIIDPITAYMGRVDSHVAADVRGALAPLQMLASETGVAVLLISHLNKGGADGSAMARVSGSGAFVAISRSSWLVAPDPSDGAVGRRILAPIKNNLAPEKGAALAYTIEGVNLPGEIATSRVTFDRAPVQITADDLLQAAQSAGASHSALGEAVAFLRAELDAGPKTALDVEEVALAAGISKGTLVRARKLLGVRAQKRGGSGPWELEMPATPRKPG